MSNPSNLTHQSSIRPDLSILVKFLSRGIFKSTFYGVCSNVRAESPSHGEDCIRNFFNPAIV